MPVNYASMRRVSPPQIGSPPLCRYLWLAGTRFSMRAPAAPREPDHRPHRNDEVRPGLAVKSRYALPSRWHFLLGSGLRFVIFILENRTTIQTSVKELCQE